MDIIITLMRAERFWKQSGQQVREVAESGRVTGTARRDTSAAVQTQPAT